MRILSIDIGGTNIKTLLQSEAPDDKRKEPSGPDFTPEDMVRAVTEMRSPDEYDVITIGLPSPIRAGRVLTAPVNLGSGWVDFDFATAFDGKPVRVLNDAAMQALGSYGDGGKMLFLGLGTGLGTCLIAHHVVMPMELGHMPYKHGLTYEQLVGEASREDRGTKSWRKDVWEIVDIMHRGMLPDEIVLGGGNAKRMTKHPEDIPAFVKIGENTNAFLGGFKVWQDDRYDQTVPVLGGRGPDDSESVRSFR